jgi:signal peptidase II
MMITRRLRGAALLLSFVAVALDQLSKYLVFSQLAGEEPTPRLLWEGCPLFNLVLVWNRGISFGMFSQHPEWMPWILLGLTSLLTAGLCVWLFRTPRFVTLWGIALITGGAIGNIIDRLRFGAVIDFLDFHIYHYHWPAFNIADAAVFLGVVFLMIDSVLEAKETKK